MAVNNKNGSTGKSTALAPGDPVKAPAALGATFAERAAANKKPAHSEPKAVDTEDEQVEDKAVAPRKAAHKSSRKKS